MASNYYSMQDVMEKLEKSEKEVQSLVREGKLRQYMDSGKPVFKVEDVDALAEEVVGLDLTGEQEEIGLSVEESGEISLEPDDDDEADSGKDPDEIKDKDKDKDAASEGGFGLSQMGDETSDDTRVDSIGINLLSGTDDAYKLTEDSKAETQVPDEDLEELDELDADSNLESFGSGSGLLDLSLQADDTSLGAVLDDILPGGDEGGEAAAEAGADDIGLMDETEELEEGSEAAKTAGDAAAPAPAPAAAPPGAQMVAVAREDPASTLYGVMMFMPVVALLLGVIAVSAAVQEVTPSLLQALLETTLADVSLIWYVTGGLALLVLVMWAMTTTKGDKKPKAAKKTREKKAKKPKKPKKKKK